MDNVNKNEDMFDVTKILANIKNHDFSVADYKMCKDEADVVIYYLEWVKSVLTPIKDDTNEATV